MHVKYGISFYRLSKIYNKHHSTIISAVNKCEYLKNYDEESKQVAKKFGVEFEDFNEHDWHYALNICYHLFKDLCKDDIQMCAKLTYLWLRDKAIPEGKAFYHYMKHLKHKHKEDRD